MAKWLKACARATALYGTSRIGMKSYRNNWVNYSEIEEIPSNMAVGADSYALETAKGDRGNKVFELSNHLGNVLATVSDKKLGRVLDSASFVAAYYEGQVRSVQDYYAFGWEIPSRSFSAGNYRFGFNGKENDSDFGEQLIQDYGFRIYNPSIAKFLSVDPLRREYPELTPYQFASNTPIIGIDLDGLELYVVTRNFSNGRLVNTVIEVVRDAGGNPVDRLANMEFRDRRTGRLRTVQIPGPTRPSASGRVMNVIEINTGNPTGNAPPSRLRANLNAQELKILAGKGQQFQSTTLTEGQNNTSRGDDVNSRGTKYSYPGINPPAGEKYYLERFVGINGTAGEYNSNLSRTSDALNSSFNIAYSNSGNSFFMDRSGQRIPIGNVVSDISTNIQRLASQTGTGVVGGAPSNVGQIDINLALPANASTAQINSANNFINSTLIPQLVGSTGLPRSIFQANVGVAGSTVNGVQLNNTPSTQVNVNIQYPRRLFIGTSGSVTPLTNK